MCIAEILRVETLIANRASDLCDLVLLLVFSVLVIFQRLQVGEVDIASATKSPVRFRHLLRMLAVGMFDEKSLRLKLFRAKITIENLFWCVGDILVSFQRIRIWEEHLADFTFNPFFGDELVVSFIAVKEEAVRLVKHLRAVRALVELTPVWLDLVAAIGGMRLKVI